MPLAAVHGYKVSEPGTSVVISAVMLLDTTVLVITCAQTLAAVVPKKMVVGLTLVSKDMLANRTEGSAAEVTVFADHQVAAV